MRPVETLPMAEWRRLFEVNCWSHRDDPSALAALLCSTGTVVNISSVGGKVAM